MGLPRLIATTLGFGIPDFDTCVDHSVCGFRFLKDLARGRTGRIDVFQISERTPGYWKVERG